MVMAAFVHQTKRIYGHRQVNRALLQENKQVYVCTECKGLYFPEQIKGSVSPFPAHSSEGKYIFSGDQKPGH